MAMWQSKGRPASTRSSLPARPLIRVVSTWPAWNPGLSFRFDLGFRWGSRLLLHRLIARSRTEELLLFDELDSSSDDYLPLAHFFIQVSYQGRGLALEIKMMGVWRGKLDVEGPMG